MNKKVLILKVVNNNVYSYYQEGKQTFHQGDSGVDLYTPEDVTILPGETKFIDLGIQSEVKEYSQSGELSRNLSYYLYPRSSISKTPLRLANSVGIIDAGYRGNLKAAVTYVPTYQDLKRMVETGSLDCYPPYKIEKGTRLFQICSNDLKPFDTVIFTDELTETSRGEDGFGSTGV
jgi:dUTP pyrophosphatase